MAKYMIAYVCAAIDKQDPSWVLGALANDESGCVVAANPGLDVAAAVAATGLSEATLRSWENSMRYAIDGIGQEIYDSATKKFVPVPPTDPTFLGLVAADSVGEWNYYYSEVGELPGSAAEVAGRVASGTAGVGA